MIILQEYHSSNYVNKIKNYFYKNKSFLILEDEFINYLIKFYNVKFYFLISFDDNKNINGVLFFYLNSNSKKKIVHTFFDSFCFNNENVAKDIIFEVKNFVSKNFINSFKINSRNNLNEILMVSKKNYIISIDEISIIRNWENKPGVFRTEVRKAKKRGFTVSTIKKFPDQSYYDLYLANQMKKKIAIHNDDIFFKFLNMESSVLFTCEKNKSLAGYALIYIVNNNAHLMFSNISSKSLSHGINQYIIWEIIEFLFKKNIKHFILGPSQPDGSTAFFKKKVGGEDLDFFQYEIAGKEKEIENVKNNNKFEISYIYRLKNMIINFLPKFLLIYILKKKRINEKIF